MKDKQFYFVTFFAALLLLVLQALKLPSLTGGWLTTQVILWVVFLIATADGLIGMARKKEWSTKLFLILFAFTAINGIYLLSLGTSSTVWLYVILAIAALYYVKSNMDIYKKKNVIDEIVRQARLLQQAEKSIKEMLDKKEKKAPAKKTAKKSTKKKTAKKATKKKTVKKAAKKTTKKTAKKSTKKKVAKKSTKKKTSKKR